MVQKATELGDYYESLRDELLQRGPKQGVDHPAELPEVIALAGVVIADRIQMVVHMLNHLLEKDSALGQDIRELGEKVDILTDAIIENPDQA